MPAAAKAPLNSKNPATVAKKIYAGGGIVSNGGHGEVMCPLFNADGSICRKKCVGNFAYRSICEHIRRAHPDNWIPKLPASPETFAKMVNLPSRGLTANAVNAQFHMRKPQHMPAAASAMAVFRKTGKALSKHEDEQYVDGMSPPSSANESETLPSISLSTNPVAFQSKFPAVTPDYEEHDDEEDHDFMEEDDLEEEMRSRRSDIDTEDDSDDGRHNPHPHQLLHRNHHRNHLQAQLPPLRTGKPPTSLKRKRQSYAASNPETGAITDNSSTQSSNASRWDELIEAATTRAVAIDPKSFHHLSHHHQYSHTPQTPLSPPATASSSYPSLAPTASPPSTSSSEFPMSSPRKLLCATCDNLTPINEAFACTECMSGFCDECAFNSGRRGSCGECRAVGGKFKPLRIVVR
ncbi:hypothetical protein L873DRAFT_1827467 [Choiromyces venosus 120613-1]|uniref:RING zinc finger-like domain-containing protein n=1 Tax=Choiromyces venosus 120613-1 TaxID=1336337 RepID=A0A3N4JXB8_9PEZI|nr:hypothetical protein L873DRAFT_1827467 [Choiromyces venosus 120613-1]